MAEQITIFWFRRDLRLFDNAGLYRALKNNDKVLPLFIFDKNILSELSDPADARITFIHQELLKIKNELEKRGSTIEVIYDTPKKAWQSLIKKYSVKNVYLNEDYEPYARKRDQQIHDLLKEHSISMQAYKDQLIFAKDEVLKADQNPYVVFTPYSKVWKTKLHSKMVKNTVDKHAPEISFYLKPYPNQKYYAHFYKTSPKPFPTLKELGFEKSTQDFPDKTFSDEALINYDKTRNFPALEGTSRLSIHYRFGTISIRQQALRALRLNAKYLGELIWRDFYAMILYHFPKVVDGPFREKYNFIEWRNDENDFRAWCEGKTGYPIVDAGMRQLNQTGFMHNRVRMITASFLTKHLLINWQWGEAYFADKLQDYDLSNNNGGWQWAAGTGTDAAPYFRIFNPYTQAKKFDKENKYIKRWVPELDAAAYPEPIVDHKLARERCLAAYKKALAQAKEF